MRWPRASALRSPSMTVSTACAALTREISDTSATLFTMSALIMRAMISKSMEDRHRIDLWLKLVCLFKHRGEAADACRGGHVKINGQRVKPAATVREGDVVEFYLADHFRRVVVAGLPEGNIPKEKARTMYIDETPQQEKLDLAAGMFRDRGAGRPTKRERREIDKLRR
jgi:ribosome-associated heat shock protein Hsp15